jgi:hypothetical protein
VPAAPRLGGALRAAAVDFYFNSWRLVPANLAWAAALLAVVALAALAWPPFALLLPLVAVPGAGLYRMAALAVRDEPMRLSDFVAGARRFAVPALAVGSAASGAGLVLTVNLVAGVRAGGPWGLGLAALALDGLVLLTMLLAALWPLLVDPMREGMSLRSLLGQALRLVAARFPAMLALTTTTAALLVISIILLVTVVTVGGAYLALFTTRYVLPAADRLGPDAAPDRPLSR